MNEELNLLKVIRLTITSGAYWNSGCIAPARDVNHLMTRLVEEWQMFDQIIDWAIKQWRPRLRTCVREQ